MEIKPMPSMTESVKIDMMMLLNLANGMSQFEPVQTCPIVTTCCVRIKTPVGTLGSFSPYCKTVLLRRDLHAHNRKMAQVITGVCIAIRRPVLS